MSKISKSKSRSRTRAEGRPEEPNQMLKDIEEGIAETIATKASALHQNMQEFKDRMLQQRLSQEAAAEEQLLASNLGSGETFHGMSSSVPAYAQHSSPFGGQMASDPQPARRSWQNPRQVSFSPPSFRHDEQTRQSFGRSPHQQLHNQSFLESSIGHIGDNANANIQTRQSLDASIHQVHQLMQIPMPQNQLDVGSKLVNANHFIHSIITMVEELQSQREDSLQNNMLLPRQVVDELRLKLTGAFERLAMLGDEASQGDQLLNIFQNFMADIGQKIHVYLSQSGWQYPIRSELVQQIILNLADKLTQYEFYDALPLVAKGLHDLRISLAVQKLQSLHNGMQDGSQYKFVNMLKQEFANRRMKKANLQKVLKRYLAKYDRLSVRTFFKYWQTKVQKEYRQHMKDL